MYKFDVFGTVYSIGKFEIIFTVIFVLLIIVGFLGSLKADKRSFSNESNRIAKEMEEEYKRQREEADEYDDISKDIETEYD